MKADALAMLERLRTVYGLPHGVDEETLPKFFAEYQRAGKRSNWELDPSWYDPDDADSRSPISKLALGLAFFFAGFFGAAGFAGSASFADAAGFAGAAGFADAAAFGPLLASVTKGAGRATASGQLVVEVPLPA